MSRYSQSIPNESHQTPNENPLCGLSPQAAREVKRDTPLRRARTCYGHLAGVAGVYLMDQMRARDWLEEMTPGPSDRHVGYSLTVVGVQALEACGVDAAAVSKTAGRAGYGCLDWTERRQHLGGVLGRAIVDVLGASGYILRSSSSREVEMLQGLQNWLDGSETAR